MASADMRKSVLITGAGVGGIGGALAKEFHAQGYRVFCAARRMETIAELVEMGMDSVLVDVTDPAAVERARDEVAAKTGGRLDVLVNNAGIAVHRPALDLEIETTVKLTFDTNVYGPMRMVQAFGPLLIAAEGTVVNIGSIAPIVPLVYSAAYNASKAALHAYGDCLRNEMAPFNVGVITVVTGGVQSHIVREAAPQLPASSLYRPAEQGWFKRVSLAAQSKSLDAGVYAKHLVAQVRKSRKNQPVWYWRGRFAWQAWFLWAFMPMGFVDRFLATQFGLAKLAQHWSEQKKKA